METLAVDLTAMWAGRQLDEQRLAETGIIPGLVRIAVGIEDTEDLVDVVTSALDVVGSTT